MLFQTTLLMEYGSDSLLFHCFLCLISILFKKEELSLTSSMMEYLHENFPLIPIQIFIHMSMFISLNVRFDIHFI